MSPITIKCRSSDSMFLRSLYRNGSFIRAVSRGRPYSHFASRPAGCYVKSVCWKSIAKSHGNFKKMCEKLFIGGVLYSDAVSTS